MDKSKEYVMGLELQITELNEQIKNEKKEVEHLLAQKTEQKKISESITLELSKAN